jgi:hypothetical protein
MKMTKAITHHDGGRQARTPVHRPSENATAAQNSGCRGGLWVRIILQFDVSGHFHPGAEEFRNRHLRNL